MGGRDSGKVKNFDVRDEYRRKIGKQDWKKSKAHLKQEKQAAELRKSGAHAKDVAVVLGTVVALVAAIYGMFYAISKPTNL